MTSPFGLGDETGHVQLTCVGCGTASQAPGTAKLHHCPGCPLFAVFPTCPFCQYPMTAWTDGVKTLMTCPDCRKRYDIGGLVGGLLGRSPARNVTDTINGPVNARTALLAVFLFITLVVGLIHFSGSSNPATGVTPSVDCSALYAANLETAKRGDAYDDLSAAEQQQFEDYGLYCK
jgi:hypothetical protein